MGNTALIDSTEVYGKARDLAELGARIRRVGEINFPRNEEELLVASSNLVGAGKAITNVAAVYNDFLAGQSSYTAQAVSETLARAKCEIDALIFVSNLVNDSSALAFLANPTPERGYEWAADVARTFRQAADLIPPNVVFVSPMLRGLLAAPAHYLKAFEAILDCHLRGVDLVAGISGSQESAEEPGLGVTWEGDLSKVYANAPYSLRRFMRDCRNKDGVDLWKVSKQLGIAHLMNMIREHGQEWADEGGTTIRLTEWLAYLARAI